MPSFLQPENKGYLEIGNVFKRDKGIGEKENQKAV
jgi:hypothetical protein